jgi:hypothetical protein
MRNYEVHEYVRSYSSLQNYKMHEHGELQNSTICEYGKTLFFTVELYEELIG